MFSRSIPQMVLLLGLLHCLGYHAPVAKASQSEGVTAEERDSIQQAKDPEHRLKLYLDLAEARLKEILLQTRKLDKENSAKAVSGFKAAVTGADDCVAKEQGGKAYRKLVIQLHKAMRKYNFTLLQALEKAAENFRGYIQSAYEVSQRVQDSAEIQMARFN